MEVQDPTFGCPVWPTEALDLSSSPPDREQTTTTTTSSATRTEKGGDLGPEGPQLPIDGSKYCIFSDRLPSKPPRKGASSRPVPLRYYPIENRKTTYTLEGTQEARFKQVLRLCLPFWGRQMGGISMPKSVKKVLQGIQGDASRVITVKTQVVSDHVVGIAFSTPGAKKQPEVVLYHHTSIGKDARLNFHSHVQSTVAGSYPIPIPFPPPKIEAIGRVVEVLSALNLIAKSQTTVRLVAEIGIQIMEAIQRTKEDGDIEGTPKYLCMEVVLLGTTSAPKAALRYTHYPHIDMTTADCRAISDVFVSVASTVAEGTSYEQKCTHGVSEKLGGVYLQIPLNLASKRETR